MNNQLYSQVLKTIQRYDMLEKGDRVLIGVSGGPDSVFLLMGLYNLRSRLGIEIFVANLDHGIRGGISRADSRFVRKLSNDLKVKYIHRRLKLSKNGLSNKLSTEEILREKRYKFFKEAAKKVRTNIVATGHTLDDQAETVLMRTIKGSTIKGLTGILPAGKKDGLNIMRPLIEVEKKSILAFLNKEKIPYRTDHTNLDERYFRNAVRRRVLPYLEKYNPRIKRSLSLMAESLRDDREFIEDEIRKRRRLLKKNGEYVEIKLKDIVIQPKTVRREILRGALMRSGANIKKLTFRHWKEMDEFLKYKRNGQALDLPGGIVLKRGKKKISFKKKKD